MQPAADARHFIQSSHVWEQNDGNIWLFWNTRVEILASENKWPNCCCFHDFDLKWETYLTQDAQKAGNKLKTRQTSGQNQALGQGWLMGLASSRACFAPRERQGERIAISETKPSYIQEHVIVGRTEYGPANPVWYKRGSKCTLTLQLLCRYYDF